MSSSDAGSTCGSAAAGGGAGGTTATADAAPVDAADAAADLEGGDDASTGSCGTAGEVVPATSGACVSCVDANCCLAASACNGPCLALIQCYSADINVCATQYPAGLSPYIDFASCLRQSCGSACPTLPLPSNGDL